MQRSLVWKKLVYLLSGVTMTAVWCRRVDNQSYIRNYPRLGTPVAETACLHVGEDTTRARPDTPTPCSDPRGSVHRGAASSRPAPSDAANSCLVLRAIRWVVDSARLFFFARGGGGLSRGATSGLFNPFRRGALCALAPLFLFAWVLTAPEMAQSADGAEDCGYSDPTVREDKMGTRLGGMTVDPFVKGILSGGPFTPHVDTNYEYGSFSIQADGSWIFRLDNDHPIVQRLGHPIVRCLVYTVQPENGDAPVTQRIRIEGADDPPTNLKLTWLPPVKRLSAAEGRIPGNTSTTSRVRVAKLSVMEVDFTNTQTFGVTGADASSFVLVGWNLYLKAGTDLSTQSSYKFKVIVTSGGVRIKSSTKTLTVGATPDAPGRPTVNPGDHKLEVSWSKPSANGAFITRYEVRYRAAGSSASWSDHSFAGTGTSTTIDGLTNGQSYIYYNLRYQQPVSGHSIAHNSFAGTSTGTSTTFPYYGLTNGDTYWRRVRVWAGLHNGQSYQVQVRAISSTGPSDWSPIATGTPTGTPAAQAPDAPDRPTLTPGNSYLEVSWSPPSTNGASISGYKLQYSEGNDGVWKPYNFASTSTTTSIPIPMLINGQPYQVQVRAISSAGPSDWSPIATGTPVAQAPDAPGRPTVNPGNAELEVSWTAPADNGCLHQRLRRAVPAYQRHQLDRPQLCGCRHQHHHRRPHQRSQLHGAGAGDQLGRQKRLVDLRHGHPGSPSA